jgi:NitT/TauT family transport system ATP-binding protein
MTPRPGRLVDDLVIKLPRPRPLDVMTTPEFGTYTRHIRARFNVKGGLDA